MEVNRPPKPEPVVKLHSLNTLCRICFENSAVRPFFKSNFEEGLGVYSEMIFQCFSIQITPMKNNLNNNNICENCVNRLHDSCKFKAQIENSLRIFEIHLDSIEVPIEQDKTDTMKTIVKSESPDYDNFDDSVDVVSDSSTMEIMKKPIYQEANELNSKLNRPKKKGLKNKKRGSYRKRKQVLMAEEECDVRMEQYRLNKDMRTCDICNESFYTHISLMKHLCIHFPKFVCDICGRCFRKEYLLKAHIKKHSNVDAKYSCPNCDKSYKCPVFFKRHVKQHEKPEVFRYRCPKCNELFKTFYNRMKHIMNVHNEDLERYKCEQCSKNFITSSRLSVHVRKDHNLERNHVCPECEHRFFNRRTMMEHIKLKHHKIRDFLCDICKKAYSRKCKLKDHMKSHASVLE